MAREQIGDREERWSRELANLRAETERLRTRLVTLSRLSRETASSLELSTVFQHVVDSACELTGARYGALGVFGEGGRIEQFIIHGLSDEEQQAIGKLPEGLGILGWLQELQEPLRLGDLSTHPRSAGFPPNHPPMTTFLGAPIRHRDTPLGNLYLTEKEGGQDFTPEDEDLLMLFAAQAAMAIRNAQLHRQVQDLVVLEERDRIGMDLHDGVIQSLYATGLKVENCIEDLRDDPSQVEPQLQSVLEQLNQSIVDLRGYILDLRPAALADADLAGAVGALLQEIKANTMVDVRLVEGEGACEVLTREQAEALFLVAQEAFANIRKHANAHSVTATLERSNSTFRMTISDDGQGFDPDAPSGGFGLRNIHERVSHLGGRVDITSSADGGTQVVIELSLRQES